MATSATRASIRWTCRRWGLGVKYPTKVSAIGGHFMFDDDQETPNTLNASFEFDEGGKENAGIRSSPLDDQSRSRHRRGRQVAEHGGHNFLWPQGVRRDLG